VKHESNDLDKAGLLAVTFACIVALTWISIKALGSDKLDPNASTLLGAIVAGLIATAGACIQAIRGYSMSAQLGKVTDQLAAAGPIVDPEKPQPVAVTNDPANPVPVDTQA
jgi:hypothetical protein